MKYWIMVPGLLECLDGILPSESEEQRATVGQEYDGEHNGELEKVVYQYPPQYLGVCSRLSEITKIKEMRKSEEL